MCERALSRVSTKYSVALKLLSFFFFLPVKRYWIDRPRKKTSNKLLLFLRPCVKLHPYIIVYMYWLQTLLFFACSFGREKSLIQRSKGSNFFWRTLQEARKKGEKQNSQQEEEFWALFSLNWSAVIKGWLLSFLPSVAIEGVPTNGQLGLPPIVRQIFAKKWWIVKASMKFWGTSGHHNKNNCIFLTRCTSSKQLNQIRGTEVLVHIDQII